MPWCSLQRQVDRELASLRTVQPSLRSQEPLYNSRADLGSWEESLQKSITLRGFSVCGHWTPSRKDPMLRGQVASPVSVLNKFMQIKIVYKSKISYILTSWEFLMQPFCSSSWNECIVINSTHKIRHTMNSTFASQPLLSFFFRKVTTSKWSQENIVLYWPVMNILMYSQDLLKLQV